MIGNAGTNLSGETEAARVQADQPNHLPRLLLELHHNMTRDSLFARALYSEAGRLPGKTLFARLLLSQQKAEGRGRRQLGEELPAVKEATLVVQGSTLLPTHIAPARACSSSTTAQDMVRQPDRDGRDVRTLPPDTPPRVPQPPSHRAACSCAAPCATTSTPLSRPGGGAHVMMTLKDAQGKPGPHGVGTRM
ncbi:hypothetical protein BBO_06966 [Beauveria brongniartii RCEF 3172]|uniref:Uncharacterized protein n=1 Tax=Beauveria brongniartii RCEF 3172 TaxID=1081107 RepID=A0A167AAU4_9HYPO|nr:hypothetical protein BBO_06966 [Beauveria brongniartii RCEF 3172]